MEIVIGGAYKHMTNMLEWLRGRLQVNLLRNLNAEQMCQLMQDCAVAVISTSGVAYEYAAVIGLLYILETVSNQMRISEFL
jgi:UDP-2,4-diacetamido-2,4,6-trideoxy-beta-L-altropyranose hydrolase